MPGALGPKECVFKEELPDLPLKVGKELIGLTEGASQPPPPHGRENVRCKGPVETSEERLHSWEPRW